MRWFIGVAIHDGRNTPRFNPRRKTPVGLRFGGRTPK